MNEHAHGNEHEDEHRPQHSEGPSDPVNTSGRHPVNVGHLVMGVAFLGLVIVWGLITSDAVDLDRARWILPLPWLTAGAVGLLATLARNRRPTQRL
ncbi:MAG: hypothetical protein L0H31_11030 [Nocardioidaceae bacterium]|nr:hypothetical protein [Nocardioidaceae bacterium]